MSSSSILLGNHVYRAPYETNTCHGAKTYSGGKKPDRRKFLSKKQSISPKKEQKRSIKIGSNSESAKSNVTMHSNNSKEIMSPDENNNISKSNYFYDLSWESFEKLKLELEEAQNDQHAKDEQWKRLSEQREKMDQELEELTISLFEEANKMVFEANFARARIEKKLHETQLKSNGLQAEVDALKLLVLTSTPSNPGNHHSKIAHNVSNNCYPCYIENGNENCYSLDVKENMEVDPLLFCLFSSWLKDGSPSKDHKFLAMVMKEDILPCLSFPNEELSQAILIAAQKNTLNIETVKPKLRKCCLTNAVLQCNFRIQTKTSEPWYTISSSSRARIVAVANFLTFLRYIKQGVIVKDATELYQLIIKRRLDMSLAKLGIQTFKRT